MSTKSCYYIVVIKSRTWCKSYSIEERMGSVRTRKENIVVRFAQKGSHFKLPVLAFRALK